MCEQTSHLCATDTGARYACGHTVCDGCRSRVLIWGDYDCQDCHACNEEPPKLMYVLKQACDVLDASLAQALASDVPASDT